MLETRWYDSGSGYVVLAMDPDTSGMTWEDVQALIVAGETLPATVYRRRWGYEENRGDAEAKAAHLEMCKRETLLLAEVAFAPTLPAEVTLSL